MATVGSLFIKLGINSSGFERGLVSAYDRIVRFTGRVATLGQNVLNAGLGGGHVLDAAVNQVKAPIDGLTKSLQSLVSGIPIVGPLLSHVIGTAGGVLGGAVNGILTGFAMIREAAGHAKEALLNADKLGISVESLTRLEGLAGVSGELMVHGLMRLQQHLGEASSGSHEAYGKFMRLGYSMDQVRAMGAAPLDQVLGPLFDRIRSLPTHAERAAAASALFGHRISGELLPAILQGSQGLERAAKRADALGLTLTRVDAVGLIQAGRALNALDKVFAGIKRQIAIELAPVVVGLAQELEKLVPPGTRVKDVLQSAFDGIKPRALEALDGVQKFVYKAVDLLGKLVVAVNDFVIAFRDGLQVMSENPLVPEGLSHSLHDAAVAMDAVGIGTNAAVKAVDTLRASLKDAAPWSQGFSALLDRAKGWLQQKSQLPPGVGTGAPLLPPPGQNTEHQFAAAMEAGTKEAMSAINKALFGDQSQAARAAAQAATQRDKTNGHLVDIKKLLERPALVTAPIAG